MTGEYPPSPGSVNDVAETMGLEPRDQTVLMEFTRQFSEYRTVVAPTAPDYSIEFGGRLIERSINRHQESASDERNSRDV